MRNSSNHGDLAVFAVGMSLVIHVAAMFFAAPRVMSVTMSPALEAKRTHHPPMSVRRFEGDPARERRKTQPKEDVPAPRTAPVAAGPAAPAPSSDLQESQAQSAPAVAMPEILTGSDDAAVELPKPVEPASEAPAAAAVPVPFQEAAVPAPSRQAPAFAHEVESFIPQAGADAPAPVFTLPAGDPADAPTDMQTVRSAEAAPKVDYVFSNKVLDSVNEGFVEKEKAAVRELLSVPDAASAESAVECEFSSCVDPGSPRWRYFKLVFSRREGADPLPVVPKDMVILIDASGSIGTDRLKRCRTIAQSILRSCLNSGDRFNLVAFRNRFSYAFREWRDCDAKSFEHADAWLSKLAAHGRTDVFSVIRSVLTLPRDPARPVIALVVTDGDANTGVSGTAEILSRFTALNDGLVSVYMYGVKREANRELIELLTRGNRGESFIHTGTRSGAGTRLEELAMAFRDPVLTDLRIAFTAGSAAETYPRLLKNLYAGRKVVLRGRCPADVKEIVFTLQGLSGGRAYESLYRFDVSKAAQAGNMLPAEWAEERAVAARLR